MTNDALTVELDADLAEKVRAFASASGTNVDSVVREAVADYVHDWSEALERLAEFDRAGESLDAEAVLAEFIAAVAARRSGLD